MGKKLDFGKTINFITCLFMAVGMMTTGSQADTSLYNALGGIADPDHIIGSGTPESCTEEAFRAAVAEGGVIVFDGGDEPFTITLMEPAKVFNDGNPDVVIDGGGLVTLSGGGQTRILYMNTCDRDQHWTTSHCQNQDHPRLTVQNITFADGNSTGETEYTGGGAIWVRGGSFKALNCTFINNVSEAIGPDVGGGAIRVFSQYDGQPVDLINCTFGGAPGQGNIAANGGAISSIGVSWNIVNSVFTYNEAMGNGGNPAKSGTPGGGSGGAIYNDGNEMVLRLENSLVAYNTVTTHGSGIFFVSNNHTGHVELDRSSVENNYGGSWYPVYPEISCHSDTVVDVTESGVELAILRTTAALSIDGNDVSMEAYNINGNNYYKLRDFAMAVDGSEAGFSVAWDEGRQLIKLGKGEIYSPVGGEFSRYMHAGIVSGQASTPEMTYDGRTVKLEAYNIAGNNYFKLRDLCEMVEIAVEWSEEEQKISLMTDRPN